MTLAYGCPMKLANQELAENMQKYCRRHYLCSSKKGLCDRTKKKHVILRGWKRKGVFMTAGGTGSSIVPIYQHVDSISQT
jgi:hypothetical protein